MGKQPAEGAVTSCRCDGVGGGRYMGLFLWRKHNRLRNGRPRNKETIPGLSYFHD